MAFAHRDGPRDRRRVVAPRPARAHRARRLGLAAGSLTRLTKPMLAGGVLREAGPRGAPAVPGRPSTLWT
jgi:hypothetical protein